MRKATTFIVASIAVCQLMSSCMSSYPQSTTQQLLNVPLVAHHKNVELFFDSDLPKNQDFLKVIGISAEGEQYTDYNTLVTKLKAEGQRQGVDAIVYINSSQAERSNQTIIGALADLTSKEPAKPANFYSYQAPAIHGIGIKYLDSMAYIRQYVKAKHVYAYNQADSTLAPALSSTTWFSMMGEELATQPAKEKSFYETNVQLFSLDFLLEEKRNWSYRADEMRRVAVRKRSLNNVTVLKCKLAYQSPVSGVLQTITIMDRHIPKVPTKIMRLVYGAGNLVVEKRIFDKENKLQLREILTYDAENRIETTVLYQVSAKGEAPVAKTVYEYYSPDDVKAIASR